MKILFVVPWYATEEQPHAGTFFRDLAEGLTDEKMDVRVHYPLVAAGFREFLSGTYSFPEDRGGNVPVHYSFIPNMIPRSGMLRPWLLTAKSLIDLQKVFRSWGKPDLVHAHSVFRAGFVARQINRWFDIPYIISEHYSVVGRGAFKNAWSNTGFSKLFARARRVTAVSSSLREDLVRRYDLDRTSVAVIPNPVHGMFYETFQPKQLSTPFHIHYTAFLREIKRPGMLIEVVQQLQNRDVNVEVTVAGNGGMLRELKQKSVESGVDHRITFLGNLSRSRIKQIIDRSHAVISTSEYETFGLSLLEGMACGRPVIATDSGGPRDFIDDDNGILVEEHSVEAVSGAIHRMIDRYETYDQEEIQNRIKDQYSDKRIVSKVLTMYKGIMER